MRLHGFAAATRCCAALQQVICACSPASRNYEETLGTLKFATFSKSIVNRVAGKASRAMCSAAPHAAVSPN
jgi:hypothetical protein